MHSEVYCTHAAMLGIVAVPHAESRTFGYRSVRYSGNAAKLLWGSSTVGLDSAITTQ